VGSPLAANITINPKQLSLGHERLQELPEIRLISIKLKLIALHKNMTATLFKIIACDNTLKNILRIEVSLLSK